MSAHAVGRLRQPFQRQHARRGEIGERAEVETGEVEAAVVAQEEQLAVEVGQAGPAGIFGGVGLALRLVEPRHLHMPATLAGIIDARSARPVERVEDMGERAHGEVRRRRLFGELGIIGGADEAADRGVGGGKARRGDAGIRLHRRLVDIGEEAVIVEIGEVPIEIRPVGHHPHGVVVNLHLPAIELDHQSRAGRVVHHVMEGRFHPAQYRQRHQQDRLRRHGFLHLRHRRELAKAPAAEIGGGEHGLRHLHAALLAAGGGVGQQAEGQPLVVQPFQHFEIGKADGRLGGGDAPRHGDREHGVARAVLHRRVPVHLRARGEAGGEIRHLVGQIEREFERAAEIGPAVRVAIAERCAHEVRPPVRARAGAPPRLSCRAADGRRVCCGAAGIQPPPVGGMIQPVAKARAAPAASRQPKFALAARACYPFTRRLRLGGSAGERRWPFGVPSQRLRADFCPAARLVRCCAPGP